MAIVFDTTNYVSLTGYTVPSEVTISFWLQLNTGGVVQRPFGANGNFELRTNATNQLTADIFGGGSTGTTALNVGELYHVMVTGSDSGDSSQVFVNGVLDSSNAGQTDTATGPFLSYGRSEGNAAQFLDGVVADFRIYNRVLSAEEAQTIYASRGHDSIVDGLEVRHTLSEKSPGSNVNPLIDSNTATTGSATSLNITAPSNTDGDLMVAVIAQSQTGATITAPAGWILGNAGNTTIGGGGSEPSVWFFYKTASSEPASYTFTSSVTATILGGVLSYEPIGSNIPQIIPSIINTGSSAAPVSPSITANDRSLILRICCADDDDVPATPATFWPPNSTGRVSLELTGTGNGVSLGVVEQVLPSGATGTATWTLDTTENWGCLTVAFNDSGLAIKDVSSGGNDGQPLNDPAYNEEELSLRRGSC